MGFPNNKNRKKPKRSLPKSVALQIAKDRENGMIWTDLEKKYKVTQYQINGVLQKFGLLYQRQFRITPEIMGDVWYHREVLKKPRKQIVEDLGLTLDQVDRAIYKRRKHG